jgi:hypothetical protein
MIGKRLVDEVEEREEGEIRRKLKIKHSMELSVTCVFPVLGTQREIAIVNFPYSMFMYSFQVIHHLVPNLQYRDCH